LYKVVLQGCKTESEDAIKLTAREREREDPQCQGNALHESPGKEDKEFTGLGKMSDAQFRTVGGRKCGVIDAIKDHDATVIFMHGLGDTYGGWQDQVREIASGFPSVRWILPLAPVMKVGLNGGQPSTAWYDISVEAIPFIMGGKLDIGKPLPAPGIEDSRGEILAVIQEEINAGVDPARIVVGGFSMGAATALYTGLQLPVQIGGVLALSGYIPNHHEFCVTDVCKSTPVFQGHGFSDQVLPFAIGQLSSQLLKSHFGATNVEFKSYPMPHSTCLQEISDVTNWLTGILKSGRASGDGEGQSTAKKVNVRANAPVGRRQCLLIPLYTKVRVFGLQSSSSKELNGLTGVIVGANAEKKTFVVRLDANQPKDGAISVKGKNLIQMVPVTVDGKDFVIDNYDEDSDKYTVTSDATELVCAASDVTIPPYTSCVIRDIQNEQMQSLNGTVATVTRFDSETGRYEVQTGQRSISLKPENLRL
jgi:predicted esterase